MKREETRRQALERICTAASELKIMASANDAGTLAYLLDMAALEARAALNRSRLSEAVWQTPNSSRLVAANSNERPATRL